MTSKGLFPGMMLMSVLTLAACGGGGGGGDPGVTYDPDTVTQALDNKIGVDGVGASLIAGAPPAPGDSQDLKADAPDEVPDAETGSKVTIPVSVSSSTVLDSLFAKVPGAGSYFQVELPEVGGKAARVTARSIGPRFASASPAAIAAAAKADTVLDFEITLPDGLESGRLCFEFSVRDADGAVSNVDVACLNIRQSSDEPPPTGSDSAAECLNPEVFAVGTTVVSTFEETSPFGTTTNTDSYTVTRQTTFNGESAVELTYDDGYSDYLRVDAQNQRVLSIGSQDSFETCTYDPPLEFSFGLSAGESRTQQITQSCSEAEPIEATVTTNYVGPERITVPAGTFDTCRFRQTFAASGFTFSIDTWISSGSGIEIQIDSDGFGGEFSEVLVEASINGQPVTGN